MLHYKRGRCTVVCQALPIPRRRAFGSAASSGGCQERADRWVGSFLLSPHSMLSGSAIVRLPFLFPTNAPELPRAGQTQTRRADFRADGRETLRKRTRRRPAPSTYADRTDRPRERLQMNILQIFCVIRGRTKSSGSATKRPHTLRVDTSITRIIGEPSATAPQNMRNIPLRLIAPG